MHRLRTYESRGHFIEPHLLMLFSTHLSDSGAFWAGSLGELLATGGHFLCAGSQAAQI